METIEYENGRVKKVTDKGKHGTISETTYAYDKNGNVTKENDTTYIYDDGGRVTKITTGDGKTFVYSYDQNGNFIDESDNGDGNRLSKYDNEQVKFDKGGNMTKGPLGGKSMEYQYNEFSQLVKAGETEYTYYVNGNRASMTDINGETTYVMDVNSELPRLLIRENSDGSRTVYVYGHGLISQETEDGEGNRKDYRLFHYDYRGSTTSLTDGNGNVTDKMSYSAYGGLETRDGDTETVFLYVGREGIQTDGNGLYYMRARYYNPEIGRFVNEDPIRDGENWYSYCGGDPVNKIDPSGLAKKKVYVIDNKKIESLLQRKGGVVEVHDLKTGKKFKVKLASWAPKNTYHMDNNPYREKDAKIVNSFASGENRWNHRPGVVKLGKYYIACSFHTMPHADNVGGYKGLGWESGHMCIHVLNSFSDAANTNNRSGPGWKLEKGKWVSVGRKRGYGTKDAIVKEAYKLAIKKGYKKGGNWKK